MAPTLLKVAEIVGNQLAAVRAEIDHKLQASQGASASMIVAGQRRGGAMRLFLIYPEGNFIEATEDTPFPADRRAQVWQADPGPGCEADDQPGRRAEGGAA